MALPTVFPAAVDPLNLNDTIPPNINLSTMSYFGAFLPAPLAFVVSNLRTTVGAEDDGNGIILNPSYDDGNRVVFDQMPDEVGLDQGWTTVETILLRFDTSDTPFGRFPVYLNKSLPHAGRVHNVIGYDAAVCVQKYESWIIEAYNTSIASPSALRIVEKGDISTSALPSGNIRGAPIENTRYLNTSGKGPGFYIALDNSINKLIKENARSSDYLPSATVGPIMSSGTTFLLTSALFRRLFLSPMALDLGDTPNSPQTGSPLSADGSVRLTPYHTWLGRDSSSHNCTWMRR